jgi:hypothetical protein
MEAIRNYTSGNRSLIINIVYIVALLLVVFYIYRWWKSGDNLVADLLPYKIQANKEPVTMPITNEKKPRLRIRTGGEYTLSFWTYITSWEHRNGLPKAVFQITDDRITVPPTGNYLMVGVLYPNEAKMMIRTYTGQSDANDITNVETFKSVMAGTSSILSTQLMTPSADLPQCDIQDIDLQRWVHTAISVNGRIVDVYMDGKLARSCILPNIPKGNDDGKSIQSVILGSHGGFGGWYSGVQFYAYAVTPDRIYSTYQAGPYSSANFLTYMAEKLGIKVTYTGEYGIKKEV